MPRCNRHDELYAIAEGDCPECRREHDLAAAEKAVVDAAVRWRASTGADYDAAHVTLRAAVDALLALRGGV